MKYAVTATRPRIRIPVVRPKAVELYVALRLPDDGTTWWGRRWRQGSIRISPDSDAKFVPYRPRKAKSFDLTGIELVGEVPSSRLEQFWFESKTKLLASSPTHERIEMGFGPGPWAELAHRIIRRRPWHFAPPDLRGDDRGTPLRE